MSNESLSHKAIDVLDHFISKGQCSMFGANGSATVDKGLLQLRALDWNVDGQQIAIVPTHNVYYILYFVVFPVYTGPFKNYPQITVYHPNSSNGHSFANIGWTGWIGSITGMNTVNFHAPALTHKHVNVMTWAISF